MAQLQSVQNAAVRLFGDMSLYDIVTPVLPNVLHWLPMKKRTTFKIGELTYKALNGLAPSYLSEMLVSVTVNPALRRNRSADRGDSTVPRTKNINYGDRRFAIAAPALWNYFPVELHRIWSTTTFCNRRMTYLFRVTHHIAPLLLS